GFNKKIAILGDMYELGDQEEFLHRDIATAVKPSITEVITVGDKAKWIYDGMTENETQVSAVSFDNKEDAASYLSGRL
ncbi:UDP-N-acetylmuramoyl-tripeptide--D-alanyl-D-alanine ligase, partial [Staphylococcus sp. SIMBA_130]